jgi:hypothetical protein
MKNSFESIFYALEKLEILRTNPEEFISTQPLIDRVQIENSPDSNIITIICRLAISVAND